MNPRLDALQKQFDQAAELISTINTRATDAGRTELDETEQADYDKALERANDLKARIEKEKATDTLFANVAKANTVVIETGTEVVTRATEITLKDAADFALTQLGASLPTAQASQAAMKLRTLTSVTSASSSGSLRENIVGDIIRFVDAKRRTVDSFGVTQMPAGADFTVLVQGTHTNTVAIQANEGDAITSNAMPTLTKVTVNHDTYAGGAAMTLQSLYFPVPNSAELWAQVAAEDYAMKTDAVVCAAFKAAATNTLSYAATTGESLINALGEAALGVYTESKAEADTIWMTPDVANWLRGIHLDSGEPYFPMINPMNRDGVSPGFDTFKGVQIGGLDVVIDPNFATSTFIVGARRYGRVYEFMYPELQAWDIEHLLKYVAIAGELGTYFRPEGFVKLIDSDGATPNSQ